MQELIGTVIANHYRLDQFLGEGGMSFVFKCTDLYTDQTAAIKLLKQAIASNRIEDVFRFRREATVVSELRHPNLVRVYEVGQHDSLHYIAMELMDGITLDEYSRKSGGPMDPNEALSIVMQIAATLGYVHSVGVIHRDIKPGNVMIALKPTGPSLSSGSSTARSGTLPEFPEKREAPPVPTAREFVWDRDLPIKVLDFGLSQVIRFERLKEKESVLGTFSYMSPEQMGILMKPVDERSDLYSLGILFYELLTATLPFLGEDPGTIAHQQIAQSALPPAQIRKDLPPVLEKIVLKLISKDPNDRYQSAQGLLHDLKRVLAGESLVVLGREDRVPAALTYRTRFIGRQTELRKLEDLFHEAAEKKGRACLISGDAGQGKSRLVSEFRGRVYEQGGIFVAGKCFRQQNKVPYQPFSEALTDYFNQLGHLPVDETEKDIERLRKLAGEQAEIICQLSPELRQLLGDVPSLVRLDPDRESHRFVMACANFLLNLGQEGKPVVLWLDDLQWSDEGSMTLLEGILEELKDSYLLLLGTYRDQELGEDHRLNRLARGAASRGLPFHSLRLQGFEEPEVRQLVSQLLGEDTAKVGEIGDFLFRKTKGNVLYLLEIARQLVEEKVLEYRNGEWLLNRERINRVPIPLTMLEAIQQRIKGLDADHAELLATASVLGMRFKMDALYALMDAPKERVIQWVDDAIGLQLLDKGATRGELVFVHDQIRQAFYQPLDQEKRRRLHARAAQALEAGCGREERTASFDLAHHFYEAGNAEKCLEHALPAGEEARRDYANEEAAGYYSMALQILAERREAGSPLWVRAKEGLEACYSTLGRNDAAIEIAQELLSLPASPRDHAGWHRRIGMNYFRKSDYGKAEDHLAAGLSMLGAKLPKTRWAVWLSIGWEFLVHSFTLLLPKSFLNRERGDVRPEILETAQLYQSCTILYVLTDYVKFFYITLRLMNLGHAELGKSKELAGALLGYAMACAGMRRFRRSLEYQHRALKMNRDLGHEIGVAECFRFLGFTHLMMCEYDHAEKALQAAREKYHAIGDLYELTHVLNGLNLLYFNRTDLARRDEALNTMLAVSRRINNHWGIGVAMSSLAGSYLIGGDYPAAEEWVLKAEVLCGQNKIWIGLCMAHAIHSQLLLEKEDYEGAVLQADLACRVEHEHSMIRPIVSIVFIYRTDAYLERLRNRLAFASPSEKQKEIRRLRGMIKEMRRKTGRWPTFKGLVLRAHAEYCALCGKNSRARRLYLESLRRLESIERWFELGKSHYQFARFLEGRSTEEALKHWTLAFDLFKRVGALAYERRAASRIGLAEEPSKDAATLADSRRFSSLLAVSRDISSILDIDTLLNRIMAKAAEVTGARHGCLFIVNEETGELDLRNQYHIDGEDQNAWSFSRSVVDKVYRSGEAVLATNASQSEEWRSHLSVVDYHLKSVLCVPIRRQQKTLGVCYLDNPLTCGVFSGEDAELLEAFMAQSAVCIENARAYEKIRLLNEELAQEGERIKEENVQLKKLARFHSTHIKSFGEVSLVTQDSAILELLETAERYAQASANVLITGASGVGKEIFAHLIHRNSDRKNEPFIKVNCSAIPESLFESEFFGYEKGAFTGALKTKKGKFELADRGTLFLDEVADFPLSQQGKLLRILEDSEIMRLGGDRPVKVDVKVICATNKDLTARVKEEAFRQDLYFRLNVLHLHIPALRERQQDIPVLAAYFLSQVANREGGREKYFDDEALLYLQSLDFPGNVRELRNLVHRAYLCATGDVISQTDVEQLRLEQKASPTGQENLESLFDKTIPLKELKELFETRYLTAQLRKHHFNVSQTARSLDVQPSALFRKLKSLSIKVDRFVG